MAGATEARFLEYLQEYVQICELAVSTVIGTDL